MGAIVPIASALTGLAGNVVSQIGSAKVARKRKGNIQELADQARSRYQRGYYGDYLDTKLARDTLRRANDRIKKSLMSYADNAVAGGATAEAQAAQKGEIQQGYNDVVSQLARMGTRRRDQIARQYYNNLRDITQMKDSYLQQRQRSYGNIGKNAMTAAGSMLQAWSGNTEEPGTEGLGNEFLKLLRGNPARNQSGSTGGQPSQSRLNFFNSL
jgi:hypothetical protein